MRAFISGHMSLNKEEFLEHYWPKLLDAADKQHSFVIGDAAGCDKICQHMLLALGAIFGPLDVTVYHMFDCPRNNVGLFPTVGGFHTDKERDAAMTAASDYDIAWVRSGRELSGTAYNIMRRKYGK